jgi:hypothetical protein
MTSRDIEKLLRERHKEDIFVAQCKTGPTQAGVLIMDGWALKPSWVQQVAIGYEIKVSRGDFFRDVKWPGYLPYCNEFYFVTPPGLLEKDEVPEGCGLLVAAGSRLVTKKKAAHREAGSLELLYKYVLMNHAGLIKVQRQTTREERTEYWARWLEEKRGLNEIRFRVGYGLRKRISEEIEEVRRENENLKREIVRLEDVRIILKNLGYERVDAIPSWDTKRAIVARIDEIKSGFSSDARRSFESAGKAIATILKIMDKKAKEGEKQ